MPIPLERQVTPDAVDRDSHELRVEPPELGQQLLVQRKLIRADRAPVLGVEDEDDRTAAELGQRHLLVRRRRKLEVGSFCSGRQRRRSVVGILWGNHDRSQPACQHSAVGGNPATASRSLALDGQEVAGSLRLTSVGYLERSTSGPVGSGFPSPGSAVTLSTGYFAGSTAAANVTCERPSSSGWNVPAEIRFGVAGRVARADEPQLVVLALGQDRQLIALEADHATDPRLAHLDVRRGVAVGGDQSRPELDGAGGPVEPRADDEWPAPPRPRRRRARERGDNAAALAGGAPASAGPPPHARWPRTSSPPGRAGAHREGPRARPAAPDRAAPPAPRGTLRRTRGGARSDRAPPA